MKLEFEMLESNDGHYAKRAPVPGRYIYLFVSWNDYAGHPWSTGCCFVPDQPNIVPVDVLFKEEEDKCWLGAIL